MKNLSACCSILSLLIFSLPLKGEYSSTYNHRVLQANRAFATLHLEFDREISSDGGKNWFKDEEGSLTWDCGKNAFHYKKKRFDAEPTGLMTEEVFWGSDNVVTRLETTFVKDGKGWQKLSADAKIQKMSIRHPFQHFIDFKRIPGGQELILNEKFTLTNVKFDMEILDEMKVLVLDTGGDIHSKIYFDLKHGVVKLNSWKIKSADGSQDNAVLDIIPEDYIDCNGLPFPSRITFVFYSKGKYRDSRRYIFKRETMNVNFPVRDDIFVSMIPIGSKVQDMTKGSVYIETGVDVLKRTERVSQQLDALFEEALK